jgi:hypothetical protein
MRKILAILGLLVGSSTTALYGAAPDARIALVANLYREFAWEVLVVEPQATTFFSQPEAVLRKYLAPSLVQLVLNDRACTTTRQEVCSLNFSPLWDGNDPAAEDLRVIPGAKPSEVLVRFTYPHDKRVVEISYDLVQVMGSWRIANIMTKSWSLVSILQSPA